MSDLKKIRFRLPTGQITITSICIIVLSLGNIAFGQNGIKNIPLPAAINSAVQEFSGMSMYAERLYLLPQFGENGKRTFGYPFSIFSLKKDSIEIFLSGKQASVSAYRKIQIRNLNQLPDTVAENFQGFEAIEIVNETVFLSIETNDNYGYCFIIKGRLDTGRNEVTIHTQDFTTLKKSPLIPNTGFEGLTYSQSLKKLIAIYEFNGREGGLGYLIDTTLRKVAELQEIPHLPFRITDIQCDDNGALFGLNYYWYTDYKEYIITEAEDKGFEHLISELPDLSADIRNNPDYFKVKGTSYGRIVKLSEGKWEQVKRIPSSGENWEGLVLFGNGALVISDANNNRSQQTTLLYVEF